MAQDVPSLIFVLVLVLQGDLKESHSCHHVRGLVWFLQDGPSTLGCRLALMDGCPHQEGQSFLASFIPSGIPGDCNFRTVVSVPSSSKGEGIID